MSVGRSKRNSLRETQAGSYQAAARAVPTTQPQLEPDLFLRTKRAAKDQSGSGVLPINLEAFLEAMGTVVGSNQKRDSSTKTAVKVFMRFFKAKGLLDEQVTRVDRQVAVDLRNWLHDENYTPNTQGQWLRMARALWVEGRQHRYVLDNPFERLSAKKTDLPRFDRRGRDRTREEAPPWTASQIVAIARCLRPELAWDPRRLHTLEARLESWTRQRGRARHRSATRRS